VHGAGFNPHIIRREAGVSTPAQSQQISAGFSPGETLLVDLILNAEFFRSLLKPETTSENLPATARFLIALRGCSLLVRANSSSRFPR
jgi:hypothetical protein